MIDKYIWDKDNVLYNPYLKRGYEEWLSTINREKEYGHRSKSEQLRSRWEPEYVLNRNMVYLVPPIHRVKATYDYRSIRIIVRNEEKVIYDDYVEDIREIIGGYQIKNPAIEISNPLGRVVYQLVAGNEVIYESKTRLHRNFIVFDERGQEQANNKDYSGTAVFCTKSKVDKLHLYFSGESYCLSSYSAHLGDAVLVDNKVFNFSEMIRLVCLVKNMMDISLRRLIASLKYLKMRYSLFLKVSLRTVVLKSKLISTRIKWMLLNILQLKEKESISIR